MAWHPILLTQEDEPGVWRLVDQQGREFARVELRRTKDGLRYKASAEGKTLGWGTTLKGTCARVYQAYVRVQQGVPPFPGYPKYQ